MMPSIDDIYSLFLKHPIICTDTRKIEQGCLFFALKGPNFNANTFAEEALKKGAAYAIIDESEYQVNEQCILVDDVLKTLQNLASHHRTHLSIPVIAIVGSNGKTTTKELITAVLKTTYKVHATPGNLNNHIGLPLTLLMLNKSHEIAVIEMGANHVGENAELCDIALPTHGIVTNNGKDHLEGFGDIEGVAKSNSELYYYLLKNKGIAFVNANDEWLMRMSSRLTQTVTYAANYGSLTTAANVVGYAEKLQPSIQYQFGKWNGNSILSGSYNFDNIMAAIAIGKHFQVADELIIKGIADYVPSNNRSQWIETKHNKIFMDAYNANPSSMELALTNFNAIEGNPKIVIMGDMFELGKYEAEEHQRMVELCNQLKFDEVILVGKAFANTNHQHQSFIQTAEALNYIQNKDYKNCLFFMKGSRGMKLETLLAAIA